MSTRYMKKVYGGDVIPENHNVDNMSDAEISVDSNSKPFNVFDVLNQNSDDDQDVSDKQESEELVANDANCNDTKRKRKKKKRKKVENVKSQQPQYDAENVLVSDTDEIEQCILEVNQLLGEPQPSCSTQVSKPQWINKKSKENILIVQYKHLNPYNELKKIFGSKTIQAEQSKRRGRDHPRHLKKTRLICPRDNWPPIGKSGVSMHQCDDSNEEGIQYFEYQHNSSYQQIQLKFLQAVESLNPENIINIVNIHPYHVDALLQLAELCKLSEDLAMAAGFIERALYCLECAFHRSFNLTTAQCRLDYRKQQNRALFITLFKHLEFVGGRACYRTSLEFCKLLLSLDPEDDPLAVVLFIDFYALRAKEYEWFVAFCDLWESSRNLTQLPNIAYSLALAHFRLGDKAKADEFLQKALIMFPGVLMHLIEKCNIQTDTQVMRHDFFNSKARAKTSPALEKLQDLYVMRSFHLWKEADILPWLEECVHSVLSRIQSKDDYVNYCQVKRSKRYQGRLPRSILRHIILADIKEITVNTEEIQNEGPVLSYDPLPPIHRFDIYREIRTNERINQSSSNFLSLFFSSLFTGLNGEAADALNGLYLFDENDDHA